MRHNYVTDLFIAANDVMVTLAWRAPGRPARLAPSVHVYDRSAERRIEKYVTRRMPSFHSHARSPQCRMDNSRFLNTQAMYSLRHGAVGD